MKQSKLVALAFSLLLPAVANHAAVLGTAFTYQGRLTDGGNPANGIYDLRFTIYDSQTGGNPVANAITNSTFAVADGLFNTELDFGANVFIGEARWLELGVRTNGSTDVFSLVRRTRSRPTQIIASLDGALILSRAVRLTRPLEEALPTLFKSMRAVLRLTEASVTGHRRCLQPRCG